MLPPGERSGFDLIEATLEEAAARREAARCLQCASVCDKCVEVCPNRANLAYAVRPERLAVPILSCREAGLIVERESAVIVNQARQILHLPDLCNECGNCATFCVHAGKPYLDKPRLYFRAEDLQKEQFNALFIERNGNGWTIKRRERGRESWLALKSDSGELIFEDAHVRAVFSEKGFGICKMELKRHFPGELRLSAPAEMYVIARGVLASLAYLPGL